MSFGQLINLFILLGLISYSYGYNQRINPVRRRTRHTELKEAAKEVINKVFNDNDQLEQETRDAIRNDEDIIQKITHNILSAAKQIADVGSQDVLSINQWTTIQNEIRQGINVIIAAYRRFNKLHRDTCDKIEAFTKETIEKYESELSAIDELSVPSSSSGLFDVDSSDYGRFMSKFREMLRYGEFHRQTLPTSLDCISDMAATTLAQRSAIISPVSRTYVVQLPQSQVISSPDPGIPIACGALAEYNGCQPCSNSLTQQARVLLNNACPNQYYSQ